MSFPVPSVAPDAAPYTCARINVVWLSHVVGAVDMLRRAGYWSGDETDLYNADQAVQVIQAMLSTGECPVIPVGLIMLNPVDVPPDGWLICDGSAVDAGAYPDLHSYLQADYTVAGVVRLPDLRQRYVIGHEPGETTLNSPLGDNERVLVADNLPAHTHTMATHQHSSTIRRNSLPGATTQPMASDGSGTIGQLLTNAGGASATGSTGAGVGFDNRPNSLPLNWIIRAVP